MPFQLSWHRGQKHDGQVGIVKCVSVRGRVSEPKVPEGAFVGSGQENK